MKALTISLVLATSLLGTSAYAGDARFAGTVAGGALGAIVGNHVGGTNGAIFGGVAGAYLGSEATRRDYRREVVYVREPRREVYYDTPRPVYVSAPQTVYYESPRPVYYAEEHYHRRHHHGRHHRYD
jgi:uncharacterized protein YcfJ